MEEALEDPAISPSGPRSAGDVLRQQRQALGLDLADVAAALRIKPAYLAALEAGRPDELPGPTYAIGFVRAYAHHLGLDGGEVLRRFKQESSLLAGKPDLSFPMPLGERSIPGGGMLLVALILALCGYGTWYYLSTGERSRPERVAAVPAALLPPKQEQRGIEPPVPEPQATASAEDAPAPSASAASGSAGPPATAATPTSLPTEAAPAVPVLPANASQHNSRL